MKSVKREAKGKRKSSSLEHSKLIEQALKQPGVSELMAVYNRWKTLDDVARHQFQAFGVKRVILASNSSGPTVRRIT